MKIIYSNILPVKGFRAINLFGIVFARKDEPTLTQRIINHETIHSRQIVELLVFGFYMWYILEWIFRWIQYKDPYKGYRNISFEREAFSNDADFSYPKNRKFFGFYRYMKKGNYVF